MLRDLREKAERLFGHPIRSAVAGRPVHFVGAADEGQNAYAEGRLREAFGMAGFEAVQFEFEPIAAAHYYESTLDHDELIVIGDFGGGTSDFSLVRVGPTILQRGRSRADLLGNSGVGVAGDAFDARIIRHLVSPALGAGTQMRSVDKILPVPGWVYGRLERWHHLSLLKSRETMDMLRSVRAQAEYPDRIAAFVHLIQEDLGYQLHRAVQKTKCDLSTMDSAAFEFCDGVVDLHCSVRREDFEVWIQEELGKISGCVDSLLLEAGACARDVDMVFLTGGSSFVP
ncbi:MAG TPA: Hsp70 family protein [Bryobacteraceae bacterium]|nr:Hsp70 family protein [Bryobacteraceae bacterium]